MKTLMDYLENFNGIKREKINQVLSTKKNYDGAVLTLAELIQKCYIYGAEEFIQEYSNVKIKGEYRKLAKAKRTYAIYIDAEQLDMWDINLIGYEFYKYLRLQNWEQVLVV